MAAGEGSESCEGGVEVGGLGKNMGTEKSGGDPPCSVSTFRERQPNVHRLQCRLVRNLSCASCFKNTLTDGGQ